MMVGQIVAKWYKALVFVIPSLVEYVGSNPIIVNDIFIISLVVYQLI